MTLARALGLCLALLWGQGVGHAHAVAHGGGAPGSAAGRLLAEAAVREGTLAAVHAQLHAHAHAHAQAHAVPHGDAATAQFPADWIGGLHEAGDSDCRLVDQLTHADLLWAPLAAPAPEPRPGAAPVPPVQATPWLVLPAGYLARGPPAAG